MLPSNAGSKKQFEHVATTVPGNLSMLILLSALLLNRGLFCGLSLRPLAMIAKRFESDSIWVPSSPDRAGNEREREKGDEETAHANRFISSIYCNESASLSKGERVSEKIMKDFTCCVETSAMRQPLILLNVGASLRNFELRKDVV
ncbi:hypothetical protein PRIPAC_90040 [Pristionchus pacificus]|uniref:Uncharacterized protein n=1 Tax=Pristionchus pacificus TaxID=54126 RepID=A0A2A6CW15_PRIPA|nr:hypothetical protein PRIPAC_90040 [Pristionchus pacificus]|eukprot:PDM82237.1 hypothetical protein PRIPAC_36630 [Pristionchus pacificus]